MKHTDGDWFVSGQTEVVSMPSQCKIAKVSGWNYEQAQANAKLIASAPELLKCLNEAIESMQLETNNVPQNWIDAIKKVTE